MTPTLTTTDPATDSVPEDDVGILATLIDVVLDDLLAQPERPSPAAAMSAAGRAVANTRWGSYRAGRARLSSMCAIYLAWLAPPPDWTMTGTMDVGRLAFAWESPGGRTVADLCLPTVPGQAVLDEVTRPAVDAALQAASSVQGFEGVRVLALGAPTSSVLVTSQGVAPLPGSSLWFEEA